MVTCIVFQKYPETIFDLPEYQSGMDHYGYLEDMRNTQDLEDTAFRCGLMLFILGTVMRALCLITLLMVRYEISLQKNRQGHLDDHPK